MKNPFILPVAAFAVLMATGCGRKSDETAKQLEELRQKAEAATERQRALEQQLEDQKLAADREALERDRVQIENERAALEQQQGEAAQAKAEELRKREEALASREGRLQQIGADLEEKKNALSNAGAKLNDRERLLAGREAFNNSADDDTQVPVGDYGTFYEGLSSYGSWFEMPGYGYVWQPAVVSDSSWRPYSRGSWICTDRGWTWVSDEPFGWATYHYGRWALVRGRGWVWVPGSEWAPSWVSWRHNGKYVGWAPLPPETLAYRNQRWDGGVETQFGISASWYNFVEYRNFSGSLYQHCLPVSRNIACVQETTNVTYIHFENSRVICGGPRYNEACDRSGRPVRFCYLEIDRHPRPGGNVIGNRPRLSGDRLVVSAPNVDADWNEKLRPRALKGRMDAAVVERNEPLKPEIAERYQRNREESVRIAGRTVEQMGGQEEFSKRRLERLGENRRQVENGGRGEVKTPEEPKKPKVAEQESPAEQPVGNRPPTKPNGEPLRPGIGTPGVYPREGLRPRPLPAGVQHGKDIQTAADEEAAKPQQPRETRQQELQRQIQETRERQKQAEERRRQQQEEQRAQEQARQEESQRQNQNRERTMEQERMKTREAAQAEQTRNEAVVEQRQQESVRQQRQEQEAQQAREQAKQDQQERVARRQQEEVQQQREMQRQQEQARRQQEEQQQQREMQRQQDRARQQQEEQQERGRQQEENRRQQQEQARQEQERSHQQQQEQARQQQEQNRRQQQEKNDQDQQEQSRKRNR